MDAIFHHLITTTMFSGDACAVRFVVVGFYNLEYRKLTE